MNQSFVTIVVCCLSPFFFISCAQKHQTTTRPQAECSLDAHCPGSENPCEVPRCVAGVCNLVEASLATRCPMTLEWAQRQADLHPVEQNELGVCRRRECIPRVYCAQLCGRELALTIEPMVEIEPCFDGSCDSDTPISEDVLEVAYEGLRQCIFDCGYPYVEKPRSGERIPRPLPPKENKNAIDASKVNETSKVED